MNYLHAVESVKREAKMEDSLREERQTHVLTKKGRGKLAKLMAMVPYMDLRAIVASRI